MLLTEGLSEIASLSLQHNHSYYISVVAADKMGHCSAVVSHPITIDVTQPQLTSVRVADGRDAGTVLFLHDDRLLTVELTDLEDLESGLESVSVKLLQSKVSARSSFCKVY